jgi:hypothetical protein
MKNYDERKREREELRQERLKASRVAEQERAELDFRGRTKAVVSEIAEGFAWPQAEILTVYKAPFQACVTLFLGPNPCRSFDIYGGNGANGFDLQIGGIWCVSRDPQDRRRVFSMLFKKLVAC